MSDDNQSDRLALTSAIMGMMESWGLSLTDIKEILDLQDTPVRKMDRFRRAEPFPETAETNKRLEHVVGIAEGLRTAYPANRQMVKHWLNQPNRKFGKRRPLEVMSTGGLKGIVNVRAEIDCTFACQINSEIYN